MSDNSERSPLVLQVAVPTPLPTTFDYLPPLVNDKQRLLPGMRLHIPFGRSKAVGVIMGTSTTSQVPHSRLKKAYALLDDEQPVLPAALLSLCRFAAEYYHHPIGEVIAQALPVALRKGKSAQMAHAEGVKLTPAGEQLALDDLQRAPLQRTLLAQLQSGPVGRTELLADGDVNAALRRMQAKGWVEPCLLSRTPDLQTDTQVKESEGPELNPDQTRAVQQLSSHAGFRAHLLYGVTGSGKTEVYIHAMAEVLARGQQVLVLVPEISLTPQLQQRFRRRFAQPMAVLHSSLAEGERARTWLDAAAGHYDIVLGTRSAVFAPLPRLGLIVIDEEHDLSFKQQEGFRYHARDIAVMRARQADIPIVLGSATPSFESLANVEQARYELIRLPERAGSALHPQMHLLDVRSRPLDEGLSHDLLARIEAHLHKGHQVLLYLNRRGYAPTLLCHDCGWVAQCPRCDAHMTLHQAARRLRCHHCGHERAAVSTCEACQGTELRALGQGTERSEQVLERRFPQVPVLRIDRDTTRRKGALEDYFAQVRRGKPVILIGTQLLAKGHDFPNVTLVGILDSDQGLFSADFRAAERMGQQILQVAGRAGRAEQPGEVLIQTHHPDHPVLRELVGQDYERFAAQALAERRAAQLPPFTYMALLRAEASDQALPMEFLQQAAELAQEPNQGRCQILGPMPSPMERRAGRYRAQLWLQSDTRSQLHQVLTPWLAQITALPQARKVRWSLDVDPMEIY